MKTKSLLFFILILTPFLLQQPIYGEVLVEPLGIAVAFEEEGEDPQEISLNLFNDGDAQVSFKVGFNTPEHGDQNDENRMRRRGPRRDQPDGIGILIQNVCGWSNWDFERYFSAIEDLEYDRYRQWNQVEDVDFNDYDFMWIGNFNFLR